MQKKDQKLGNKIAKKEEKKEKKRASEKDRLRMREKQKSCLITSGYVVGKYAFFLAKLVFSHSYANLPKISPQTRNW